MHQEDAAHIAFEKYRSRTYFPELDGIRAICVLGVITAHLADEAVWKWMSGGLGVNVFFVLSGYLITMLSLREERKHGALSLRAFYIRRTMRIFPLYYFALLVYCVLMFGTNWGSHLRGNFRDAIPYYLTYLQEIPFAYDVIAANKPSPFAHSWSLGIEEKYYLVWPVLAFVAWRSLTSVRITGTLVLLVLFSATQSIGRLDSSIAAWKPEIILHPYSNILWGCLLAILMEQEAWYRRLSWLGKPVGMLLCLAVFIAAQLAYFPFSEKFQEVVILHAAAATALLASILTGAGPLVWLFRTRPAVFVGRISYGIYLFHGLGISAGEKIVGKGTGRIEVSIAAFVVSALATIVTAYALAIVIERPLIRVGRRWSERIMLQNARSSFSTPTKENAPLPAPVRA